MFSGIATYFLGARSKQSQWPLLTHIIDEFPFIWLRNLKSAKQWKSDLFIYNNKLDVPSILPPREVTPPPNTPPRMLPVYSTRLTAQIPVLSTPIVTSIGEI